MSEKKIIPKRSFAPVKRIVAKKSEEVVKKVVQMAPKAESDSPKEAEAPESVVVSGWKKNAAERAAALQPRILKPKSETWDKMKASRQKVENRSKGLVIFVYAMPKAGKTHFALSASQFQGIQGTLRSLPKGAPVYVLDTENSVEDEAEIKFSNELKNGDILIENCFVENNATKEIDPVASMEKIEEWAYGLADERDGTLVIDSFTDYCEFAYYKLVDRVLKIGFDDGKENKTVMPLQYKWKTKKVVTFLRRLRNVNINVILTAHGKEETISTGSGPMDYAKTGKIIADALDKAAYWVDVIAILDKSTDADGNVTRKLVVTDCRFETADMKNREYMLENESITVSNLIDLFKDLL